MKEFDLLLCAEGKYFLYLNNGNQQNLAEEDYKSYMMAITNEEAEILMEKLDIKPFEIPF